MKTDIDFVIPWVDGSDPEWLKEFARYHTADKYIDASPSRYRDWDYLRYWFRAVERFAPWVRRVHFITWGHLPQWLNIGYPNLNVVRHEDFIPHEYLPVFSSHPIELLMHHIKGLSERFVYFNDDMFLGRPVTPDRFFRCGLPCDTARLGAIAAGSISHIIMNNVEIINCRHDKKKAIKRHPGKWFNRRYSAIDMFKTLTLMPWDFFPGFKDPHMPQPFLRSTFEKLWTEEKEKLFGTLSRRFRSLLDHSQYLMRYEQLATGCFAPVSYRDTRLDLLGDENIDEICSYIQTYKYAMFCLNDSDAIKDFEKVKKQLLAAFEYILPEKCNYEL